MTAASAPPPAAPAAPPLAVLVVEDSATMRQLIVMALNRLPGVKVTEADDGVGALKALETARFDLMLTDINMPIMDGLKLVSMVRRDPRHRTLPIIVVTTEGAEADRQRALALGANTYIRKPIVAPQLLTAVKALLPDAWG